MVWLLSLPVWVVVWSFFTKKDSTYKISEKTYMIICSLALIFVMGLRSQESGSMDTTMYSRMFDTAQKYGELRNFLESKEVFDVPFLFSEIGFYSCMWAAAQFLPSMQWVIFITSAFVVFATAKFISRHSDDPMVSWLVFICLGLMTFSMNGMRQALAMSICLLAYRFVEEKKLFRFLIIVFIAILFHKSAIIFALVYLMRNMKLDFKSIFIIAIAVTAFLIFAQNFAFLYDDFMGDDYAEGDSFESGGVVNVLIYLIAIIGMLLKHKTLQSPKLFLSFALVVIGLSLYMGRYISTQIYERASYYFSYFLILCFPTVLREGDPKVRLWLRTSFAILCIGLFAYRISNSAMSNFEMFW